MNHRRLRLPAAMTVLALAAPVLAPPALAGEAGTGDRPTAVEQLRRDARELRDNVRQDSTDLSQRVASGVHQARHQFTLDMHRAQVSLRHWWDRTRDTVSRI